MIDIESTRAKINPSLLWRFLSSKSDESLSASAIPDSEWYAYYRFNIYYYIIIIIIISYLFPKHSGCFYPVPVDPNSRVCTG